MLNVMPIGADAAKTTKSTAPPGKSFPGTGAGNVLLTIPT
jgi:hypothetical protein